MIIPRDYYLNRLPTEEKQSQELRPLQTVRDSFKKIIVVSDDIMPKRNEQGILTVGIFDFLLNPDSMNL